MNRSRSKFHPDGSLRSAVPVHVTSRGELIGLLRQFANELAACPLNEWPSDTADALFAALDELAPARGVVYTVTSLAQLWRCSTETVRSHIEAGALAAFDVGRATVPHWRIPKACADEFTRTRTPQRPSAPISPT